MAVTHLFVSAKTEGADATVVRTSNWNAAHTVDNNSIHLDELALDARGFEYLGGVELAATGGTLDFKDIPARDVLFVMLRCPSSASSTLTMRFNADSGANYWYKNMKSIAGSQLFTNKDVVGQTSIALHYDAETLGRSAFIYITNKSDKSKSIEFFPFVGSGAAGTASDLESGVGEWVNTSVQIDRITLLGTTMAIDTGFGVFGKNL